MPINQLTNFCHASIVKNGKCPDCTYDCQNRCNNCLQEIHFGADRTYNCQNMIYCYTCSYVYKYASEINHLFNLLQYNSFTEFKILNLGCGSCADLFGINNFLAQRNRQLPVSYTGVDINQKWVSTQTKIKELFSEQNINFILSDVFDYLDSIPVGQVLNFNIVNLQYILNELHKNCNERIDEFITKFVIKVINQLPSNTTVIINDINLHHVRNIAARIFNEAVVKNLVSQGSYRFRNPTSHTYGGSQHPNDNLLFEVSQNILTNYDVKNPCSSAQIVIYKTQNK